MQERSPYLQSSQSDRPRDGATGIRGYKLTYLLVSLGQAGSKRGYWGGRRGVRWGGRWSARWSLGRDGRQDRYRDGHQDGYRGGRRAWLGSGFGMLLWGFSLWGVGMSHAHAWGTSWEAGRLDYAKDSAEVAAFVNTKEQVQLQVVLCSRNEPSAYRMTVLLPHKPSASGMIIAKLNVDGVVTHVYTEVVGNSLEFQVGTSFLMTLPESPTLELEFSKEDASFLNIPRVISFPMERAQLALTEVAKSCTILCQEQDFECATPLVSGILWPRTGFNSEEALAQLDGNISSRGSSSAYGSKSHSKGNAKNSEKKQKKYDTPPVWPIDLDSACLVYPEIEPLASENESLTDVSNGSANSSANSSGSKSQQHQAHAVRSANSSNRDNSANATPNALALAAANAKLSTAALVQSVGSGVMSAEVTGRTSDSSNAQSQRSSNAKSWGNSNTQIGSGRNDQLGSSSNTQIGGGRNTQSWSSGNFSREANKASGTNASSGGSATRGDNATSGANTTRGYTYAGSATGSTFVRSSTQVTYSSSSSNRDSSRAASSPAGGLNSSSTTATTTAATSTTSGTLAGARNSSANLANESRGISSASSSERASGAARESGLAGAGAGTLNSRSSSTEASSGYSSNYGHGANYGNGANYGHNANYGQGSSYGANYNQSASTGAAFSYGAAASAKAMSSASRGMSANASSTSAAGNTPVVTGLVGSIHNEEPLPSFELSDKCRTALDNVYERTGKYTLSFLPHIFLKKNGFYQQYLQLWDQVMSEAGRIDFKRPQKSIGDFDYYLTLYALFSNTKVKQYPQSYYDILQFPGELSSFMYGLDNRYELETLKYSSVFSRRFSRFRAPRENAEAALQAWQDFYQELTNSIPLVPRAQAIRPLLYRQMLMRFWRVAGYPKPLHLRPQYTFVQGRNGKPTTREPLEAKCSIFEGTNGDQFFFASPDCVKTINSDLRNIGYVNHDYHEVMQRWDAFAQAWQQSPFYNNVGSEARGQQMRSAVSLTMLSLYKNYGFGEYFLLRQCLSSRDNDICTFEADKYHNTYITDVRNAVDTLAQSSPRDAESLQHLHELWENYYQSLTTYTHNLSARGRLHSWRAALVQGLASTMQSEAMLNVLYPDKQDSEEDTLQEDALQDDF